MKQLLPLAVLGIAAVASAQQSRFVEPMGLQRPRQLAFRPFDMVDEGGRPLRPTDKIELSTGRVVTAQEFYASLNRLEQGLNKVGHSLRETGPRIVDAGNYADARGIQSQFTEYTQIGRSVNQLALPNRKALEHAAPAQARRTMLARPNLTQSKFGTALRSEVSKLLSQGTSLGKDATTNYTWSMDKPFGDRNLGVRLKAGVNLSATSVNSANPPTLSGSTTTINGSFTGSCQGTLLGAGFDILNAGCTLATTSRSNTVSLGWAISVAGFQILADNTTKPSGLSWVDGYSIPFQKQSQTMEFPVFGPFACSGFVGVEGEAGVTGHIQLSPIYAEVDIVPYVKAGVYGEIDGGLDAEIASAWGGIHADLTLVDDQFDLGANIGIVALDGNKIGWADEAWARNTLNLFTGKLSLVAHIFGPGGAHLQDWEYPFYSVTGYHDVSTLFHPGAVHELSWGGN